MDLPNLKELKAILKLCRSQGITKITLSDMIVEFGEMPLMVKGGELVAAPEEEEGVLSTAPSDEDMAYWSAAPDPLAERNEQ